MQAVVVVVEWPEGEVGQHTGGRDPKASGQVAETSGCPPARGLRLPSLGSRE